MATIPIRRSPHPEIEHHVHAALVERRAEREARGPKRPLRLSRIGDCQRKLWALAHGHADEDIPGSRLAIFDMGNLVEDLVVGWLRTAGYAVRDEQRTVTMIPDVDGHIDGEIWVKNGNLHTEPAILEIKSANLDQFEQCVALGYDRWRPTYGDTLQTYMGASGIHLAFPMVLCKNDSRLYAEKIRFDEERYARLQEKGRAVVGSRDPLPRPEAATSQHCAFCKWCHLAEWCWSSTADVKFDE